VPLFRTLRESCPNGKSCPTIRIGPDEDIFASGYVVTDLALLAELDLPPGETVVRIPATAAAVLLPELTTGSALV